MENKDLEHNFVISYRKGYGWYANADLDTAIFADGSIYNYTDFEWVRLDDVDAPLLRELTNIDLELYIQLQEALRGMSDPYASIAPPTTKGN